LFYLKQCKKRTGFGRFVTLPASHPGLVPLLPVPFGPDALDILEVSTRRFFCLQFGLKMFAFSAPSASLRRRSARLARRSNGSTLQPKAGFTLLEMLIVVGIIGLLLLLIAPASTTIKGGTDVRRIAGWGRLNV